MNFDNNRTLRTCAFHKPHLSVKYSSTPHESKVILNKTLAFIPARKCMGVLSHNVLSPCHQSLDVYKETHLLLKCVASRMGNCFPCLAPDCCFPIKQYIFDFKWSYEDGGCLVGAHCMSRSVIPSSYACHIAHCSVQLKRS